MVRWEVLLPVGALLLALLLFVILKNRKDKKELVDKLNQDYRKPKDEEGESDVTDSKP